MIDDDDPNVQPQSDAPPPVETPAEPEEQDTEGDQQPEPETEGEEQPVGDAESAEDEGEQPAPEKKGPSRSERYQRTIERLRRENAELMARQAPIGDVKAEVDRRLGPPPKEADFNGDYSEYTFARNAYETDKRQLTRALQEQSARDQSVRAEREQELLEAHGERVEDFKELAPDFGEVVRKASIEIPRHVYELVLESDQSPGITYYLAKNPAVAARFRDMTPTQAARELGRIEARLSQPSQQRNQPRAPKPIRPLVGGGTPPSVEARINAYIRRKYGDR